MTTLGVGGYCPTEIVHDALLSTVPAARTAGPRGLGTSCLHGGCGNGARALSFSFVVHGFIAIGPIVVPFGDYLIGF